MSIGSVRWRTIFATFFVLLLSASDVRLESLSDRHLIFLEPEPLSAFELDRALDSVAKTLTPRSLERRRKVIMREPPVRRCDLPIPPDQIASIKATGCEIVLSLRYIRAVSVRGSAEALSEVKKLSYVRDVQPVYNYKRSSTVLSPSVIENGVKQAQALSHGWRLLRQPDSSRFLAKRELSDRLLRRNDTVMNTLKKPEVSFRSKENRINDPEDYGFSWEQLSQVNVPRAHDLGYRGEGIIIGMQDTGFDNLNHDCFGYLDIVGAYDFVNGDDNVQDENDRGLGGHGMMTLSAIAGLDSGRYIGVAPDARFSLAKTEDTEAERQIEEDYWVAGLWFHDSLGADVVSSSLSYREWYEYEDRDGRTGIATRAADSAATAGIVIVNSVGNTGSREYPDSKMGIPSDGELVIAVGGVRADSSYWYRSSQGPTYDGRIKPDVVSLGTSVYTGYNIGNNTYLPRNGTSFACPVVAGIAGLILQANGDLTPQQVITILHETSSNANDPDTLIGYGIANGYAAVRMAENMSTKDSGQFLPERYSMTAYPNPFNSQVRISFQLTGQGAAHFMIYDVRGRELFNRQFDSKGNHSINWDGQYAGASLSSGTYLCRLSQDGRNNVQKLLLLR